MPRLLLFLLLPIIAQADTLDVWQLKVNQIVIDSSNGLAIRNGKPMMLNIKPLSDPDIIEIKFITDNGMESERWFLQVTDSSGNVINQWMNQKENGNSGSERRKSSIAFSASSLKAMVREGRTYKIYISIRHSKENFAEMYEGKAICVIYDE
jgi:hypothetical protein